MEMVSVIKTIEKIKPCIEERDYEFIMGAWNFLQEIPTMDVDVILRNVPQMIGASQIIKGKYEVCMQDMETRIKEYVAGQDMPTRRRLMDQTWNSDKGSYEMRITENMITREIENSEKYKKLQRAKINLKHTYDLCRALSEAFNSLQYSATELSRLERSDRSESA